MSCRRACALVKNLRLTSIDSVCDIHAVWFNRMIFVYIIIIIITRTMFMVLSS